MLSAFVEAYSDSKRLNNLLRSDYLSNDLKALHMKCQLCEQRDVYEIKSHLLPASYLKKLIGPRDYEHLFQASPFAGIEEYFGQSNLNTPWPEIKHLPVSPKAVFCEVCEKGFKVWEDECINKLEKFNDRISREFTQKLSATDSRFMTVELSLESNIIKMFFYSIIWRFLLLQQTKNVLHHLNTFDSLKAILNRHLLEKVQSVSENLIFDTYPDIVIYTTIHRELIANVVSASIKKGDPALFMLGPFNALIWGEWQLPFNELIPIEICNERLKIMANRSVQIPILKEEEWLKPVMEWNNYVSLIVQYPMYKAVSDAKNVSLREAMTILNTKAVSIAQSSTGQPMNAFYRAFRDLMGIGANLGNPIVKLPKSLFDFQIESMSIDEYLEGIANQLLSGSRTQLEKFMKTLKLSGNTTLKKYLAVLQVELGFFEITKFYHSNDDGMLKVAIKSFRDGVELDSQNISCLIGLGQALTHYGLITRKDNLVHEALLHFARLSPREGKYFYRGTALFELAKTKNLDTPNLLKAAAELEQDESDLVRHGSIFLATIYSVLALKNKGLYKKYFALAVLKYQEIIAAFPQEGAFSYKLGLLYRDVGMMLNSKGDLIKSTEYFAKSVAVSPHPDTYHNWGRSLEHLFDFNPHLDVWLNALSKYDKALELDPNHFQTLFISAALLLKTSARRILTEQDLQVVIDRLTQYVKLDEKNFDAFNRLGSGYLYKAISKKMDHELTEKAKSYFNKAILLNPRFAHPYANLANLHFVMAQKTNDPLEYKKSASYLLQALKRTANETTILLSTIQYVKTFDDYNLNEVRDILKLFVRQRKRLSHSDTATLSNVLPEVEKLIAKYRILY